MNDDLTKTGLLLAQGRQMAGDSPLMKLLMLRSSINQPTNTGVPSFINPWRMEGTADALRRLVGAEFSPNQVVDEDFRALREK